MERSKKILVVTLMSGALFSATAVAQTLAQKNSHKQDEAALDDDLNCSKCTDAQKPKQSANGNCGTTMTASYDWSGFDKLPFPPPFAPSQHGHDFVTGVGNFCSLSADNKAAVKAKIHKLVIAYGGEGKRSFALSGGTFTYTIDPKKGSPNAPDIRDWLGAHL
jgi:hypothetical protein